MLVTIVGLIIAILADDFRASNLVYTIIFSIGSGMNVMLCLQCLWEYFANKRGEVVGAYFAAYWFGNFIFKNLSDFLINPENEAHHPVNEI